MNHGYTRRADTEPLTSRSLAVRNQCLGALARKSSYPPPSDADLANLPSDVGLREAWAWWSARHTPPTARSGVPAIQSRRRRRPAVSSTLVTLFATAALLVFRASPVSGEMLVVRCWSLLAPGF